MEITAVCWGIACILWLVSCRFIRERAGFLKETPYFCHNASIGILETPQCFRCCQFLSQRFSLLIVVVSVFSSLIVVVHT